MKRKKTKEIKSKKLPSSDAADYALQIEDLYQKILRTYTPVEQTYRAAVNASSAINGFSNSTNR